MRSYDTLTEAINSKQTEGYTFDFNLKSSVLECKTLNKTFKACGLKGLLVDAYGVYSDSLTAEMIQKQKIRY